MAKYIHLLARITMGSSILVIALKWGSVGTALIVFAAGLLIHLLGYLYRKYIQK